MPLGEDVDAGNPSGAIHFLEQPDREPVQVVANSAGVLIATRAVGRRRDCVACIARRRSQRRLETKHEQS